MEGEAWPAKQGKGKAGEGEKGEGEERGGKVGSLCHAVIELQSLPGAIPGIARPRSRRAIDLIVLKTSLDAQRQAARMRLSRSIVAAGGGTWGARSGAGGQVCSSKRSASEGEMKRVRPA
jgi:hypothetical protein